MKPEEKQVLEDLCAKFSNGHRRDGIRCGWEASTKYHAKESEELLEAVRLTKKVMDNLWEKGNVNWGNTFSIDFMTMNKQLIEVDKIIGKYGAK